jgi:hypothetical protein
MNSLMMKSRIMNSLYRFPLCVLVLGLLASCSQPEQSETLLIDNIQGYSFNNQRQLFNFTALAMRNSRQTTPRQRQSTVREKP